MKKTLNIQSLDLREARLSYIWTRDVRISEEDDQRIPANFGKRRRKEWFAGRSLLARAASEAGTSLSWQEVELINFTQAPNVPGYVSLSHTKELVALALSPAQVGLDIEPFGRSVPEASADKFINDQDDFPFQDRLKQWCAKEACFKALASARPKALKEVVIKEDKFHYDAYMGTYSFYDIIEGHILALAKIEHSKVQSKTGESPA